MHYSIIQFLTEHFDIILLPNFQTQQMVNKDKRKIGKRTAREMLTWAHYEFQQRLLSKSQKERVKVYIVGEEYTSMTCGMCGLFNENLGGNETFWCEGCGLQGMDRDIHAARNILMKHLA